MKWALEPTRFGAHDLHTARRIGAVPFIEFFMLRSV
jgi:hypothetical protein